MNTPYQQFVNKNNQNIATINELLRKIGTGNKPFLNKLKSKKSKSIEFLELIDANLENILKDINLQNIRKQLDKSKKLFERLLGQEYINKIASKSENNKTRLMQKKDEIYRKHFDFFAKFSSKIKKMMEIINQDSLSIDLLNNLLSIQTELINLFQKYYDKTQVNYNVLYNRVLGSMWHIKRFIMRNLFYMTPNNQYRNINKLFSEYQEVIKMNISGINSIKKNELADYIMDLAKFIYKKIEENKSLTEEGRREAIQKLIKLDELYHQILKTEYNAMRSMKYNQSYTLNIPNRNRNTYEKLLEKNSQITKFINLIQLKS